MTGEQKATLIGGETYKKTKNRNWNFPEGVEGHLGNLNRKCKAKAKDWLYKHSGYEPFINTLSTLTQGIKRVADYGSGRFLIQVCKDLATRHETDRLS